MAAYTRVPRAELARHLARYALGDYAAHEPIADGIENSNYRVALLGPGGRQECILTLLEGMALDELGFFNRLLAHLADCGLPVAAPKAARDASVASLLCGKPALLFPRLPGAHLQAPAPADCAAIGRFLGELHLCLAGFGQRRESPYHLEWLAAAVREAPLLPAYRDLAEDTVGLYRELLAADLPAGLIHGDLFLDNALFVDGRLTGVIDFYHACHDLLIQDLAIAINDWCRQGAGIDGARRAALLAAYGEQRQLTEQELRCLAPMQEVSALKFALTRYATGEPPLKDPLEMLALLAALRQDRLGA